MRAASLLLYLALFSRLPVKAQLDLLTLREVEAIAEKIPEVRSASNNGGCPLFSPGIYDQSDEVRIQARRGCGSDRGTLIENYKINRRTAAVLSGGDLPEPVDDGETRTYMQAALREARARAVSIEEAACLAREGARALPGWNLADSSISIKSNETSPRQVFRFTVTLHSSLPADNEQTVDVSVGAGRVTDYETGRDLMTDRLGALTAKILAVREPMTLTDQDALGIAASIRTPSLIAAMKRGCRLYPAGPFRPDETEIGAACGEKKEVAPLSLIVNLKTGDTRDGETGNPLQAAQTALLARKLLAEKARVKAELQNAIGSACPPR